MTTNWPRPGGGHAPILTALCKYLEPSRIIECGSGLFSTPILAAGCPNVVSIEHDADWGARVYPMAVKAAKSSFGMETYPLSFGIHNGTARRALTDEQRDCVDGLYARLATLPVINQWPCDILFVDTFTCARVPALVHLGPLAKVIVIHDTESTQPDGYALGQALPVLEGRYRYSYRPNGHTPEWHVFTHTDVFSREPLDAQRLTKLAWDDAIALWGEPAPLMDFGTKAPQWMA